MRLDKYLKLSCLVKRRSVAAEMIDAGAVRLNGRPVKPASDVSDGDIVSVAFPFRLVEARVISSDERALRRGEPAAEIVAERRLDPEKNPWDDQAESLQGGHK
ncbi:ribosome-associated heat shock protein implicated in recycling of 50S subunit [Jonquetella anthropi DSM 22815]|uniref:Ribosome-associated heat shock protein implicated in recycling of 50S subunit n=1 Tax=Jonquetella anthropi DSM 22815 TaxID=885272 RepID=H0UIH5_9BACT|nr:RNA-binding S4 domain-containing protein [Jonquetella anthropi]EEX47729.1 S4 domain protein [Jonquetella anthropi E3_33 E1]EHM12683.1 ribosome-associated heat shock protein implicated in recycling of 50S subunit [Jonquetella anthropi DSM 22815]